MTAWKQLAAVDVGTVRQKVTVEKHRSTTSGITVYLAQVPGPLVCGTLVFATEAHSDAGEPHCLEHLVFMGSESYPYKGVLDLVANRSLAQGTNAWTETDHTAFTVETVGARAFLHVLPVYLDHLFFPLLRESAFRTEVYHVVGETCADAGVVYSEMEARENTAESKGLLRCLRSLYGEPARCGYAAETGGILDEIRQLTNERVRAYHQQFYRPDNFALFVSGVVDRDLLFATLSRFEQRLVSVFTATHRRPWSERVPPAPRFGLVRERVLFPAERADCPDEATDDTGIVFIGWRGPPIHDLVMRTAIEVMNDYLSESGNAPLQEALVECSDPFCNDVSFMQMDFRITANILQVENVPMHRLDDVFDRVMGILEVTHEQGIDVNGRLRTIIERRRRQFFAALEDGANDAILSLLIPEFLYNDQDDQGYFRQALDMPGVLAHLAALDESFWREHILRRWYLPGDGDHGASLVSCIVCQPSKDEANRLRTEAALRIQERLERLSAAERVALGQRLQESVAEHQVSIPESLVPVCSGLLDPASISRFRVETIRIDDVGSGVRLQIDDVDSEFVRLTALLDTRGLSGRQRLLLPLFLETLFNTRVGERDHRAVRDALLADTVDYGCAIGLSKEGGDAGAGFAIGAFSQLISVTIKSERALYETCVHWLYDILYRSQLETDRVRIAAQKLLNDVAQHRRDGSALVAWLSNEVLYGANDEANIPAMAPFRQRHLLRQVLKLLGENRNDRDEDEHDDDDEHDGDMKYDDCGEAHSFDAPERVIPSTLHHRADEMPSRVWTANALATDASASPDWSRTTGTSQRYSMTALLDELEALRRSLTSPGKVFLHAVLHCDERLDALLEPWKQTFGVISGMLPNGNGPLPAHPQLVQFSHEVRPSASVPRRCIVAGVDGVDSCYAKLISDGPKSFLDPDYPLYLVLFELLDALEGPLWRDIRGAGLAYGYNLGCTPESGTVSLSLYRSTAFEGALSAALGVLERFHQQPQELIDENTVASACSGVLCTLLNQESTVEAAAFQRLCNSCRGFEGDYTGELLAKVINVTPAKLTEFATRVLAAFRLEHCLVTVVTNPAKAPAAMEVLQSRGALRTTCVDSLDDFFALEKTA